MNFPEIFNYKLSNGLKILAVRRHNIPKVSVQLWYDVGSKDESSSEKGIAHLIEHMIFKGTSTLSECDINLITSKLSGYSNAFTSYDYTGYLFNFPSQHWYEALPIMADCMQNATFKEDFLNSELKAVIQELKMYKDDYVSSLLESLMAVIFNGNPYQHPIIGYKQDLWNLYRKDLVKFYQKYYIPNNANLIVVGDIEPENVYNLAEKYFGNIKPNWDFKKKEFYHSPDIVSKSVTLYRDIQQPIVVLTWIIPGLKSRKDYAFDILAEVLTGGRSSRLYNILINELNLTSEVESFIYDLFDYGMFVIYFRPLEFNNISTIIEIIKKEINSIIEKSIKDSELERVRKKVELDYLRTFESNQQFAYTLGKYYLATDQKNYIYDYFNSFEKSNLKEEIQDLTKQYIKPYIVNIGKVLPLEQDQKNYWLKIQEISDKEDVKILNGRERKLELETGKCVFDIEAKPPKPFNYPKSKDFKLNNGLKVLYYNNSKLPKINIILDFKAKHYYDPDNLEGLCSFTYKMLLEGTKNYTAQELANAFETYGININITSGRIFLSLLSKDLPKALELLQEILVNATFDQESIEKVRQNIFAKINDFWDTPTKFVTQLAKETIYKNHPYSKNVLGNQESISSINQRNLIDFYNKYLSPQGARFSIVGDLENYDLEDTLNQALRKWQGQEISDLTYPKLLPVNSKDINYPINRDQIVLCYAGLSIGRDNPDFDSLLIFDYILTGGSLGSMSSKLFDLRERTGLFYTIGGSLLYNSTLQPGLIIIKTIVSTDKLAQAEDMIESTLSKSPYNITDIELDEAKRSIANSLVDNFESNAKIANTILFLDIYNLPKDYFDTRAQKLSSITKDQIEKSVTKYLNTDKLIKIKAGRLS